MIICIFAFLYDDFVCVLQILDLRGSLSVICCTLSRPDNARGNYGTRILYNQQTQCTCVHVLGLPAVALSLHCLQLISCHVALLQCIERRSAIFFNAILVFLLECQTFFRCCKLSCQLCQLVLQTLDLCGSLSVILCTLSRPNNARGNCGTSIFIHALRDYQSKCTCAYVLGLPAI